MLIFQIILRVLLGMMQSLKILVELEKSGLSPTQIAVERSLTVHPFVTNVKAVLDLSSPRGIFGLLARAELTLAETATSWTMTAASASIPLPLGEVASSLHKVIIKTSCV